MKVCIEPDCWVATAGARCPEHEREWQQARNRRPGRAGRRTRAYMDTPLGSSCFCCQGTTDLTRHHVIPLSAGGAILITMCRPCNSSIGTKLMTDHRCPMHGGTTQ